MIMSFRLLINGDAKVKSGIPTHRKYCALMRNQRVKLLPQTKFIQ